MSNFYKVNLNNGKFIRIDDEGFWSGNSENMGKISPQTMLDLILENGIEGWIHGGYKQDVKYEVSVGGMCTRPIYFNTYFEAKNYYDSEKECLNGEYIGMAKVTREELHSEFIDYEKDDDENSHSENIEV